MEQRLLKQFYSYYILCNYNQPNGLYQDKESDNFYSFDHVVFERVLIFPKLLNLKQF